MTYRVPYAQAHWGDAEREAVAQVLAHENRLVAGLCIREFELRIAALLGMSEGVMVNSGSSANLIALLGLKRLFDIPDDAKVLTPVLTGGWIVGPILQALLKPVFCDVEPGTYVAGLADLREAIDRTKPDIVLYPLLLGNSADLLNLSAELKGRRIRLIVDSCDTLNPAFIQAFAKVADAVTTSFYASHIITAAGGGGMACFRDQSAADNARKIAYWGRQSIQFGDADDLERRFQYAIDGIPYDAKFVFADEGYNLQPTEMQAAFGLAQLKRLPERITARAERFSEITRFLTPYADWLTLPRRPNPSAAVWLAYPVTITKSAPFSRMELARALEMTGIQTRPIMGGNITRQPAFYHLKNRREYPVADDVMANGLMFGCHESLDASQMAHLRNTLLGFMEAYR